MPSTNSIVSIVWWIIISPKPEGKRGVVVRGVPTILQHIRLYADAIPSYTRQ
jgi:hypothetical protein